MAVRVTLACQLVIVRLPDGVVHLESKNCAEFRTGLNVCRDSRAAFYKTTGSRCILGERRGLLVSCGEIAVHCAQAGFPGHRHHGGTGGSSGRDAVQRHPQTPFAVRCKQLSAPRSARPIKQLGILTDVGTAPARPVKVWRVCPRVYRSGRHDAAVEESRKATKSCRQLAKPFNSHLTAPRALLHLPGSRGRCPKHVDRTTRGGTG